MLGRYRSQYHELATRRNVARETGTVDQSSPLLDMATASFGKARVSCWTTSRDRQWGVHDHQNAVVMRLRMQAAGPEDCKLSDFELNLEFSVLPGSSEVQIAASTPSTTVVVAENHAEVCLIELPAPSCVPDSSASDRWRFRSLSIADEQSGRSRTARWIWETANEHRTLEAKTLHGGIALRHPGQAFLVTCQVKGKVTKPGGIRLKFSNAHHDPRTWKFVPVICDEDLKHHINSLEDEMVRLNTPATNQLTQPLLANAQQLGQHGSHGYGASNIGGGASVHLGNAYYNYGGPPSSATHPGSS